MIHKEMEGKGQHSITSKLYHAATNWKTHELTYRSKKTLSTIKKIKEGKKLDLPI